MVKIYFCVDEDDSLDRTMSTIGNCFVVFCLSLAAHAGIQPPKEKKLHHFLLQEKHYNKLIRPFGSTGNGTGQLTVRLGMRLSQLLMLVGTFCLFFCLSVCQFVCRYVPGYDAGFIGWFGETKALVNGST